MSSSSLFTFLLVSLLSVQPSFRSDISAHQPGKTSKRTSVEYRMAAVSDSVPNLKNGLAQKPPMGWNSWNAFHTHINEDQIKAVADDMVVNGMKEAGYNYLVIDDAWMDSTRTKEGKLIADPRRFPHGMKALVDYIHSKGLKFGIYESAGTQTCAGYPGSLHHEKQDAQSFASWGVDYLKYDNCSNQHEPYIKRYANMRRALLATGRPIVYSLCEWGIKAPWEWAGKLSNLWRTTGDIRDNWQSVMYILDRQVGLFKYAGPGHWNDPDMLEVGNGGMTTTEYKAHFSLWAILSAPLIAGTDLRQMSAATKNILENKEVIAVNQDPKGVEGHKAVDRGKQEVWVKPLQDGSKAVLFLNRGPQPVFMTAAAEEVGFQSANYFRQKNLWTHKSKKTDDLIRASVPSHGVAMYRVWPK